MRLDRAPQPLGEAAAPRRIGLGQDDDELLTAPAGDRVSLAGEGGEEDG